MRDNRCVILSVSEESFCVNQRSSHAA